MNLSFTKVPSFCTNSRRVLILCNSTSIFSLQKLAPFSWLRQTQCRSDLGGHRLGAVRAEEVPTATADRYFSNSCLVVYAPPGYQFKCSSSASMRCLPLYTLQSQVRVGRSLEATTNVITSQQIVSIFVYSQKH